MLAKDFSIEPEASLASGALAAQVAPPPARLACQSASKTFDWRLRPASWSGGLPAGPHGHCVPAACSFSCNVWFSTSPSCHSHEPWAVILPRPALSQLPRSSPFVGSRRLEKRFVSVPSGPQGQRSRSCRHQVSLTAVVVTATTMDGHTYRVP